MMRRIMHTEAWQNLWWRFVPGTVIKVKWPVGPITYWVVDEDHLTHRESADPNDHYRGWLEKNVGKQCWDWDWQLTDNDCAENVLTIKFRKGKTDYATLAAMRWS